ncbi:hypothetical protein SADUNF_Sadunf19G0100200 [Salix dunnii]|uniref:Uncharacterized protein n=1 Tax=Salix dunnii TaxID=1413687 RepID=A0A835IZC8_9ROSI|nr:hypothetical protein SADUNF_Sadunf19G0100200 [Salix dunnii]
MLISELSFCSGLNIGSCFIIFTFLLIFLVAKGDARRLGLIVDLVKYWLSVSAQPTDTVCGIKLSSAQGNCFLPCLSTPSSLP